MDNLCFSARDPLLDFEKRNNLLGFWQRWSTNLFSSSTPGNYASSSEIASNIRDKRLSRGSIVDRAATAIVEQQQLIFRCNMEKEAQIDDRVRLL